MSATKPDSKGRRNRPRSGRNRAHSAHRDRHSPEGDDYVVNLDFYDSIPGINDQNGRSSRTRYSRGTDERRYNRAKSQGVPRNRNNDSDTHPRSNKETFYNKL